MVSVNHSTLSPRQVQQALGRGAKDVLVANGIQPSNRRGNKELTLAVQRLAQQTYSTLDDATQAGQALGQKIVDISQANGKTELDGGIVRQLMLTGEIPAVTKVTTKPAKSNPMVVIGAPQAIAPASAPVSVAAAAAEPATAKSQASNPPEAEVSGVLEPTEALEAAEAPELEEVDIAELGADVAAIAAIAKPQAPEPAVTAEADATEPEAVGAAQ
ncbi:MAG TPA: hypothetical protein VEZ50_19425 [Nodosilinea sp.]|nr:hypothetical protein [Nodosilinea sp.]